MLHAQSVWAQKSDRISDFAVWPHCDVGTGVWAQKSDRISLWMTCATEFKPMLCAPCKSDRIGDFCSVAPLRCGDWCVGPEI